MSNFERNMEKIFDVSPKEQPSPIENKTELVPIENIAPISEDELTSDLDKDYLESRRNLQQLVKKGNDAIEHLLAIATETEHPRAFEVVATLIKNTAEVNEKLMNMQKQIRDLKGLTKQKSGSVNVDKAIFVGSTSELSKLIKGKE
jgi:hypothetical protein